MDHDLSVPPAPGPAPLGRPLSAAAARSLIEDFWAGLAPVSRRGYKNDLKRFVKFLEPGGWTAGLDAKSGRTTEEREATLERALMRALRHFTTIKGGEANALALRWKNKLQGEGKSPATVARHLAALKSLTALARRLGMIEWAIEIKGGVPEPRRDMRGPKTDEVARILALADAVTSPVGLRNAALFRLLSDRGLRRGEVVELDVGHVTKEGVLVRGKGKKERKLVDLAPVTLEAVLRWLAVHPRGKDPQAPLFVGLLGPEAGGRLTGTAVWKVVKALGEAAGVEKQVRPHGLRHAGITRALDISNGNIRFGQGYSRHAKPEVLMRYDDERQRVAKEAADAVAMPSPVVPLEPRPDVPRVEPLKPRSDSPRVEPLKAETPKRAAKKAERPPRSKGEDLPW